MITLLKFLHIACIGIWAAGLVGLPGLYVQRATVDDDEALFQLQKMVRYAYVTIISPAAFLAVASGIALVFAQGTFAAWFSLKLALVACLVVLHVLSGLVIIRLFRRGQAYPLWRFAVSTTVTCALVVAILLVVLAKPDIHTTFMESLFEPGGLRHMIRAVSPWSIS